jgi:hypothetical protein
LLTQEPVIKVIIQIEDLPKMSEKSVSLENFEKLRQIVLQDVDLQKQLQEITERDTFISRLVEIGRARDLQFESEDVLEAMRENRRVWVERWI